MNKEVQIGRKILKFANNIERKIGGYVSEYGITGTQSRILWFLHHNINNKDIFQKDIEKELNTRRSSVTSVLNLMESNNLIKRESVCEDGRLKKIILTDKGLQIHKSIHGSIMRFEESLKDELSDEEFNTLIKLLDRLLEKTTD